MEIKEFAKSISGKEYGYPQFTKEEIKIAKENGFVIVYGASDDLMEFEGAIDDEVGCCKGGITRIEKSGAFYTCYGTKYKDVFPRKIKAIWCGGETSENGKQITWTYETDIPHETFMIYEGGEPYCRGIVFSIEDLK